MANKFRLIIGICTVFGFIGITSGTLLLIIGSIQYSDTMLYIALACLGLGFLIYLVLLIVVTIYFKRKSR